MNRAFIRRSFHAFARVRAIVSGAKLAQDVYLGGKGHCIVAPNSRITIHKGAIIHAGYLLRTEPGAEIIIGEDVHFGERVRLTAGPNARIQIAAGCWFNHDIAIDCRQEIVIGEKCLFGPYSYINDNNHDIQSHDFIIDQGFDMAPIRIGNGVWLGVGATLIKGSSLGDGAVIAARSLVNKPVPAYEIWGGIPAKHLGDRDK